MSVYNGGEYLRDAVESILTQSFRDFEFIIIDDGSTDGSWDIITGYAAVDKRVVTLKNPENIGLTRSLNKGLAEARGAYVARQDADDISMPHRLAREAAFLDTQYDTVLVTGNMLRLDEQGNEHPMMDRTMPSSLVAWNQVFRNMISPHSAVMFRKDTVQGIGGYNEEYRYSQDYELWSRLMDRGRLVILPDILLKWRNHAGNISGNYGGFQKELGYSVAIDTVERISGIRLDKSKIDIIRKLLNGRRFAEPYELCSVIDDINIIMRAKTIRDKSLGLFGKRDANIVRMFMASRLFKIILYARLFSPDRCIIKLVRTLFAWITGIGLYKPDEPAFIQHQSPEAAKYGLAEHNDSNMPSLLKTSTDSRKGGPDLVPGGPAVSLVITCYNYGHFLAECVDSVLGQTYRDFEIIIVNDGSTDDTAEVAAEIARSNPETRITVLNIDNVGFPESRNIGITNASGRYIMPLDADDKLAPTYLEETVRLLDEKPEVAVAYTGIKNFGELAYRHMGPFDNATKYDVRLLKRYNIICGCSLFRKSAWENVGGYKTRKDGLDGFYDWAFWIALAKDGLVGEGIDKPLYMYRTHGPSRMDIAERKRRKISFQIRLMYKDFIYPRLYRFHPVLASVAIISRRYLIEPVTHYLYRKSPDLHKKLRRIFLGGD